MRIKVNRRYYFTFTSGYKHTYFGYLIKRRNAEAYDCDDTGKFIPLRYNLKCYHTSPITYYSKKDNCYKVSYWDSIVTSDVKNITIITSKQFNTMMLLYGPKIKKGQP